MCNINIDNKRAGRLIYKCEIGQKTNTIIMTFQIHLLYNIQSKLTNKYFKTEMTDKFDGRFWD